MVESLDVFPENMLAHLSEAMLATDMADYLVERGVPFRKAHHQIGEAVRYAEETNTPLSEIPLEVLRNIAPQFEEDFRKVFSFKQAAGRRDGAGGTAPQAVELQIEAAKELLGG